MYNKIRAIMISCEPIGYFLQVVPITCLVTLIYILFRLRYLKRRKVTLVWSKEIMKTLFVGYFTGLVNLIVLPDCFWVNIFDGVAFGWWNEIGPFFALGDFNLKPTLLSYLRDELTLGSWVKTMLIGNIFMFLPFGFFLPFIAQRVTTKKTCLIAVFVPLIMELLQLFLGRSFDIDDLLGNFFGIICGYFIAMGIKALIKAVKH